MSETRDDYVETPSEGGVEVSMLTWLDSLGWETYGHDGGRGAAVLDEEYDRDPTDVIYWDILREKILELNEEMSEGEVSGFLSSLRRDLSHDNLVDANESFHSLLREGKPYTYDDGETRYVRLVDYPDNEEEEDDNRYIAANQYTYRGEENIRPDVVLFVNGIPVVVTELKSSAQDNNYQNAITDLQNYQEDASRLFVPVLFNVAADSFEFRYGGVGSPRGYYFPWNEAPEEYETDNPLKQPTHALLNPETVVDVLENYVFYERGEGGTAKIVPRYMQYYASERILSRIRAGRYDRGLIWHTQGSGKSYTMIYTADNLLRGGPLDNPQVLIVVDTDKLRDQMTDTLANIDFPRFEVAESMDHLQQLLEDGAGMLVLTTIQMFEGVDSEVQGNPETVVLADEAHRFMEKDLGTYLHAALPDAHHYGFTGTPVRQRDRDTFENYCPPELLERHEVTADEDDGDSSEEIDRELYLHRYSIKQGIKDEVILPVHFEVKQEIWDVDEEALDVEFERSFADLSVDEKEEVIREHVTEAEFAELRPRVESVVEEIVEHYEEKIEPNGWKGMVVTPSRRAAAMYGEELMKYRDPEDVEVFITSDGDDDKQMQKFHTSSEERRRIVDDFKDEEQPKLLVVCDMLLTGFDAPVLKAMYLDRHLSDHNLLQAIARTNRPAEGKNNGLIVDFAGVYQEIDSALQYPSEIKENAARSSDDLLDDFEDKLEEVMALFDDVAKVDSQEALYEAIDVVNKNKRGFEQGFQKLEDLYESISPDGRLETRNLLDRYKWLNKVYVAYRRSQREEEPEDSLREKTTELLEEHVDMRGVRDNLPTYELSEEHLEQLQDLEPKAQATEVAHAVQHHLQDRRDKNPRYKRLSDRVNEIIERWHSGELEDPEAFERLETVERDILDVEQELTESQVDEMEYAVKTTLEDAGVDESDALAISEDVVTEFEDIDKFPGWKSNRSTRDEIRSMIIRTLVSKHERRDLYVDELIDEIREYLIRNHD